MNIQVVKIACVVASVYIIFTMLLVVVFPSHYNTELNLRIEWQWRRKIIIILGVALIAIVLTGTLL